mmetsp:Transcript_10950/g.34554  ORF Transcript_10950/g.34554 Transcript_10950/m.34554 type:complete len:350 (-) Transcript_10950:56-1105(-)
MSGSIVGRQSTQALLRVLVLLVVREFDLVVRAVLLGKLALRLAHARHLEVELGLLFSAQLRDLHVAHLPIARRLKDGVVHGVVVRVERRVEPQDGEDGRRVRRLAREQRAARMPHERERKLEEERRALLEQLRVKGEERAEREHVQAQADKPLGHVCLRSDARLREQLCHLGEVLADETRIDHRVAHVRGRRGVPVAAQVALRAVEPQHEAERDVGGLGQPQEGVDVAEALVVVAILGPKLLERADHRRTMLVRHERALRVALKDPQRGRVRAATRQRHLVCRAAERLPPGSEREGVVRAAVSRRLEEARVASQHGRLALQLPEGRLEDQRAERLGRRRGRCVSRGARA